MIAGFHADTPALSTLTNTHTYIGLHAVKLARTKHWPGYAMYPLGLFFWADTSWTTCCGCELYWQHKHAAMLKLLEVGLCQSNWAHNTGFMGGGWGLMSGLADVVWNRPTPVAVLLGWAGPRVSLHATSMLDTISCGTPENEVSPIITAMEELCDSVFNHYHIIWPSASIVLM